MQHHQISTSNNLHLQLEDQVRVLETKLETSLLQNKKLTDSLTQSQADQDAIKQELSKKQVENARLVTSLNEARAQIHFSDKKTEGISQSYLTRINELEQQVAQVNSLKADVEQKCASLQAQLGAKKDELDQKRNQQFLLQSTVGKSSTENAMQKQEIEQQKRRIADLQNRESILLTDKQKIISERDALQFSMTSLVTDLNNQKSSALLQSHRFDQEVTSLKDQLQSVSTQLEESQKTARQAQLDLVSVRGHGDKFSLENASLRAQIEKALKEKQQLHQDLDQQKTISQNNKNLYDRYLEKQKNEMRQMQEEHAALKKNVNKVMLRRVVKNEEDDGAMQERFRLSERIAAEAQNRKKDTSLMGAQLQELLVRNETLSKTIEERNSLIIEQKNDLKGLERSVESLMQEKNELKVRYCQVASHNAALSSTLSQRQLNEQKMYQYSRRLETAIREQRVFPMVQVRVSQLEEEEKKDQGYLKKQQDDLVQVNKVDDLSRQLKVKTLENDALESELSESQALVKTKDQELKRIYQQLVQKKAPVLDVSEPEPKESEKQAQFYNHSEVEFSNLLNLIESKTSEIIDLKTNLNQTKIELDGLKRIHQSSEAARVQSNDHQINALTMTAESQAQQMRSFTDLQSKFMDQQRQFASIQSDKLTLTHKYADLEMSLSSAIAEKKAYEDQSNQREATVKALTTQVEELRSKQERLELQLSTSVTQAAFLAMESQNKLKQGELTKLNECITKLRQENFSMRANADNNQLKVNNLTEQLKLRDSERQAQEAVSGQEIRQLQQQLAQFKSQNNLVVDQHRDEKSELQNLLLSKEEEHKVQLQEREQLIVKLQEVVTESSESSVRMRTEMETSHKQELTSICDKHDKVIIEIKNQLVKTQQESARVANENAQYKRQVDVLLGKNETLADVGEIQTEEIERLRNLPDEKKQFLSTQQWQQLNARVDQTKLQLDEKTSEALQLKAEKEILAKSSSEQLNLLQSEISGLRDQVSDLQTQNQLLMADVKRHQERALLTLVQPDEEKKAQVDKEVTESNLVLKEMCAKAEKELEHVRLQLQGKVQESEHSQRELAKLKFQVEQLKAELERTRQDSLSKDINLRGYDELAQLNKDLSQRNIDMVSKINNLQSKIDMVEKKDGEITDVKGQLAKIQAERDAIKLENDKLRALMKKKLMELKELQTKFEADRKEWQDKAKEAPVAQVQLQQAPPSGLNTGEKKELFEAIELLKSENQALQERLGGGAPKPQQQVFRMLMRALDRTKHIVQVLDERHKALQQPGQSGAEGGQDEEPMPQVGQKRQRME